MKNVKLIMNLLLLTLVTLSNAQEKHKSAPKNTIYNLNINSLTGEKIDLNLFKGKKILFVNVASECGYTPQYADLQKLHEKYKDKLVVIGLPCNQFGEQEPGTALQIQNFCQQNYGVNFIMTEKIDVKGNNQHPIYKWLTSKELNGVESSEVKWNFQKYLLDENGNYLAYFYSKIEPLSAEITNKI